jgi:hypothetical protein
VAVAAWDEVEVRVQRRGATATKTIFIIPSRYEMMAALALDVLARRARSGIGLITKKYRMCWNTSGYAERVMTLLSEKGTTSVVE